LLTNPDLGFLEDLAGLDFEYERGIFVATASAVIARETKSLPTRLFGRIIS
jgi:hypothetical protein